jgi:hypothetical protein
VDLMISLCSLWLFIHVKSAVNDTPGANASAAIMVKRDFYIIFARHTARGGKFRPKPLLPTAQAIECRPTSKRSHKLIDKTLPGI